MARPSGNRNRRDSPTGSLTVEYRNDGCGSAGAGAPAGRYPLPLMKTYRISELAAKHRLSRSTLLYYDRIGLLVPSQRSVVGYRLYSAVDARRLQAICDYREAGLTLGEIRQLLELKKGRSQSGVEILQGRLKEIQLQIRQFQTKQATLCSLMQSLDAKGVRLIDKQMWVGILRKIGMNDQDMWAWHAEFEQSAPQAHEAFLQWLGIAQDEISQIRFSCNPSGKKKQKSKRS